MIKLKLFLIINTFTTFYGPFGYNFTKKLRNKNLFQFLFLLIFTVYIVILFRLRIFQTNTTTDSIMK